MAGQAVPGTVVPSGSLTSPGGYQGPAGPVGMIWRGTWAGATAYAVNDVVSQGGSSYICILANTGNVPPNVTYWSLVAQMGATGSTGSTGPQGATGNTGPQGPQGPTAISTDSGNIAQLGSDNLILVPQSQLWSMRLRSYNAIGNPTSEVDQRNAGQVVTNPGAGAFIVDRWFKGGNGTYTTNCRQFNTGSPVIIPGTNYRISSSWFRVLLTGQQASMAAGDLLTVRQSVEGQALRELISDVHSISILVYTTVAGLKFGVSLQDSASTYTLCKLCTIPNANTWTLITLPNLPVWTASGTFPITPGVTGYIFTICLATGSINIPAANDAWAAGSQQGAVGISNFCASPINSEFWIGFVQHEPGAVCTTFQDLDFDTNLKRCQRYFDKSYDYAVKPGTTGGFGAYFTNYLAATNGYLAGNVRFKRTMAKVPAITIYNVATGAANSVRQAFTSTDYVVSGTSAGDTMLQQINLSTLLPANQAVTGHWVADTGW